MLRLAAVDDGHFHFDPRIRTDERTINEPLASIMLNGAKLADNTRYLTEMGLGSDSILVRVNTQLAEREFEAQIASGEPLEVGLLKAAYIAVDGQSSLKEIIRRVGLPRTKWVPIMANLIRCNLLTILKAAPRKKLRVAPKTIPNEILSTFGANFTDPRNGLFLYPAFLYMLQQESYRADAASPLSLVLLEIDCPPAFMNDYRLALTRILSMIIEMKRRSDVIGYYESGGYAILMPATSGRSAHDSLMNLRQRIHTDSVIKAMAESMQISIGLACIPQDVEDMLFLLSAAEAARAESKSSSAPVVMAQTLGVT